MLKTAVTGSPGGVMLLTCDYHVESIARMLFFEGLKHFQRVVGTVIVHKHHLQRAIVLCHNAFQCRRHHVGAVIYGYDDGYFHILLGGKGTAFFD